MEQNSFSPPTKNFFGALSISPVGFGPNPKCHVPPWQAEFSRFRLIMAPLAAFWSAEQTQCLPCSAPSAGTIEKVTAIGFPSSAKTAFNSSAYSFQIIFLSSLHNGLCCSKAISIVLSSSHGARTCYFLQPLHFKVNQNPRSL